MRGPANIQNAVIQVQETHDQHTLAFITQIQTQN